MSVLRSRHPLPDLLPGIQGSPIHVRFRADLSISRGRLLSRVEAGQPVHAATFLRKRLIVLDSALLAEPEELNRILLHEIWHFVWLRLGNPSRRAWESILAAEFRGGAHGELGWSAEWRKNLLVPHDPARRTRRWREYACESFCDSGAWVLSASRTHREHTLTSPHRRLRAKWFRNLLLACPLPV